MIADTRTNAGVDDISSYRKLHCLIDEPDRIIYAASAGNLSTTQTIISLLREGCRPRRRDGAIIRTIAEPTSMFRAAQLVGEAVQLANETVGKALASIRISGASSILLGGRIGDTAAVPVPDLFGRQFHREPTRRALLPDRRNQIWTADARSRHRPSTPLGEAVKVGFLSFDASIRSNLAVGCRST
jgi:putative proteasome-type protease